MGARLHSVSRGSVDNRINRPNKRSHGRRPVLSIDARDDDDSFDRQSHLTGCREADSGNINRSNPSPATGDLA